MQAWTKLDFFHNFKSPLKTICQEISRTPPPGVPTAVYGLSEYFLERSLYRTKFLLNTFEL